MPKRNKLSADRIVSAAMAMIDAEGEKAFSMRKLAATMNVDPMAIYHHHANKSALIDAVMQAMMGDFTPPEPTGDWRCDLRGLCYELLALARRHPGTFRIYETYESDVPNEHRMQEAFYNALLAGGFSQRMTVQATRLLVTYTEGFAVDEFVGWLAPDDRAELEESLSKGSFPTATGLIDVITSSDVEEDFAFGLNILLSGLEALREN